MQGYAITPQQKRLWHVQSIRGPLRLLAVLELVGPLQQERLKKALTELVASHEILRTRLMVPPMRKQPFQVVSSEPSLTWLTAQWAPHELTERLETAVAEELALPMAEGEQQTPRFTLVSVASDRHLLLINLPAYLADAISLNLIQQELADRYAAGSNGSGAEGEEHIQYGQYSLWLEDMNAEAEDGLAFWLRRQGEVAEPQLLTNAVEHADSCRPQRHRLIDTSTVSALGKANLSSAADRFVLTCWILCLARLAGSRAMDLAWAQNGRCFDELKSVIGPFTRFLPLHLEWGHRTTFAQLVEILAEHCEQAVQWQDFFDLQNLVDESLPYGFVFETQTPSAMAGALSICCYDRHRSLAPFQLLLDVRCVGETLVLDFHYDATRLPAGQVAAWAEYFQHLMAQALVNSDWPVGHLPLLPESTQSALWQCWRASLATPPAADVVALFEAHALQVPERIALVYGSPTLETEQLTYAELDQRANRLAHLLRSRGIGPDRVVPLHMPRSTALITAMLGVLKAGASYLVLETHHPSHRTAGMMAELDAPLLLTWQADTSFSSMVQLDLATADPLLASFSATALAALVSPDQAAYLLFTSGSTGKPKGVIVSRGNLAYYVAGVTARISFPEAASYALVSTPAADLGNTMIFPALCSGGNLHVLDETLIGRPNAFGAYCRQQNIQCLKITPSHLSALLQAEDPAAVLPSASLVLGGEATRWDMVERMTALRPEMRLFNHYGPTETTVGVLTFSYRGQRTAARILPLGQALPGTALYLLDQNLQPVPVGSPGELWIGGLTVSRGYHRQPAATAQRFVPDPFGGLAGARLYRTGDQARYLADGTFEFSGRIDRQVKVRGYRVELGEIEAVLEGLEGIAKAVVVYRELAHMGGQKALVAYLVPRASAIDPHQLRDELRACLQEYMVPVIFCSVARLPLTPNGKLDLQALLALPLDHGVHQTATAPRNELEAVLAAIWAEVLGLQEVGVTATLFELGGHSLQLIVLNARIHTMFQVDLGIQVLFAHPTIEKIAAAILAREPHKGQTIATARALLALMALSPEEKCRKLRERGIEPPANANPGYLDLIRCVTSGPAMIVPRDPNDPKPIPLSFAQQRLWFIDQSEGSNSTYNNPTAIRFDLELDLAVLSRCFSELERRHEVLRTVFRLVDGMPAQIILPPRVFALQPVDLSALGYAEREAQLAAMMEQEARRPFDLQQGPVWNVSLYKLGERSYVLELVLHHICSDAWSMGILADELQALYDAYSQSLPSPLPELEIQYADYAIWQRRWLEGEALEAELSYWREKLAGLSDKPSLPYDKLRPQVLGNRGATQSLNLEHELSQRLRELSKERQGTLYMTLLSAFNLLLYSYNQREDQVIGADVANRSQLQTSPLVGFFINQLALRTRLKLEGSVIELIDAVRQTALEAYDHQEVPFDKVVAAFPIDRTSNVPPLFQAKLFMGQSHSADQNSARVGARQQVETGAARLDLTMGVWDHEGHPIVGWLNYNTDLFHAETIAAMVRRFELICAAMVANPDMSLNALIKSVLAAENERLMQQGQQLAQESANKFVRGRRSRVAVTQEELVDIGALNPAQPLPALVTPKSNGCDLPQWLAAHREVWTPLLYRHGAILFRGFDLGQPESFRRLASSVIERIFTENAEHQVISEDGAIQVPVDYAADQHLLWHNENSYNYQWPRKILFACAQPALAGGETPLVDSRAMLRELPERIVRNFERHGVSYVRNYSEYLGLSWRKIFKTEDRAVVERLCREAHMDFEWLTEDRLRTRATRPAIWPHPETNEPCWFNQAQHWHFSCLDAKTRNGLAALYQEADYPRNCYYGDGSKISDEDMATILATYRRLEVASPWQQGDAVLVDNLLSAHARNPYQGPRRILVCMGDVLDYGDWRP